MAIGDNVQAGLMRVDSSAIERAGQAQAMANRAFGDALTTAAKGFFEGQAKKKKIESTKAGLQQLFPDAPEALINSMARNPEVMRTKMALENQAIQRSQIASAAASAGAARAQEAAKMEEDRRRFNIGQDKIKKAEESATNVAKFDLTRPVLPITEETPAAFLPELDPDPFAPPPTTYQGQAPAVAQLPKSFQPQAAKVVDAVQSGQLSLLEGNRIMDSIRGQAMAEQKAGPTRSEILAREKYEDEKATRESEKQISEIESSNNLTDFYNETSDLLEKINEKTVDVTGPIEGTSVYRFFSKIGDTDDEQVRRRLEMFTRKLTLDAAQNLKGALSDKDIRFLVEQAPDMDDNPSVWKKYMGDLVLRLERNANQQGIKLGVPQADPSTPASQSTLDEIERKKQLRSKRAGL